MVAFRFYLCAVLYCSADLRRTRLFFGIIVG